MVVRIMSDKTKEALEVAEQRRFELKFESTGFIVTHEHVLFEDVCEDVRRYRYVALCVGGAGVGKTHSGKRYSSWDLVEPLASRYAHRTELLIVDEAQFLQKNDALEQLRYEYDRNNFGLILMGMPGLDKILARYKQFHSRIGQVYKFKPLEPDAVKQVLSRPDLLGTGLGGQAFPEEVLPAVMNATQGNFRKLKMLVQRVERILEINRMDVATSHLVWAANTQLLPGQD